MPAAPLVSVLLAVSNGEDYVRTALESILRQTISDLELIVIDDGSSDETPEILAAFHDERLRVLRHEERRGLAASLNRGLDEARGRYVARLDADDIALPRRLERQLQRMVSGSPIAVLGSAVLEVDESGRSGRLHLMPSGAVGVRWASLFSSPFFHPSVLLTAWCWSTRAALRPRVPRERGLRPVDAVARARRKETTWPSRSCSIASIPARLRRRAVVCSAPFSSACRCARSGGWRPS